MGIIGKAIARSGADFVGAPSFANWNPGYSLLNAYDADAYASVYPSITAIANEFMTIRPYAIDKNGKSVDASVINALYHPNKQDSSVAFFEKLAVSNLVQRKTYLLVWRRDGVEAKPGGTITPDNIAGFTFLEYPAVTRADGKTIYRLGTEEYTEDEVMVIPGGVDPYNLYGGYSPSEAARRWATLDDYIADYQSGFFENGAVPSGQFIITSKNKKDFEDTVAMLQARHRGAGNNNNVTYTPRPVDPTTGKPADAQIEWVQFASANKDIDFKNLFEQTNNRIDNAYGVSQIVKGVDNAATYANAQVSEAGFAKRAVLPRALKIYTQITHELNRITNGLGVAVTFQYDIPVVADEEKVRAETKTLEVTALNLLLSQGYSLDTVVEALELSNSYKLLKVGGGPAVIDNDKPDVDEGGEVNGAPDDDQIENGNISRSNNKAVMKTQETYQAEMRTHASKFMQAQIDKAIAELDDEQDKANDVSGDYDIDDLEVFVASALKTAKAIINDFGPDQLEAGKQIVLEAGLSTENITEFVIDSAQEERYRTYLNSVGQSYGEETRQSILAALEKANAEGLTFGETKALLKGIRSLEDYRIVRLAKTEVGRAEGNASVFSMEQIQTETGYTINKIWNIGGGNPCEYCLSMSGKTVGVSNSFVPLNGTIEGTEGGVLVNDFVDIDTADAHPNDQCYITYEVAE